MPRIPDTTASCNSAAAHEHIYRSFFSAAEYAIRNPASTRPTQYAAMLELIEPLVTGDYLDTRQDGHGNTALHLIAQLIPHEKGFIPLLRHAATHQPGLFSERNGEGKTVADVAPHATRIFLEGALPAQPGKGAGALR